MMLLSCCALVLLCFLCPRFGGRCVKLITWVIYYRTKKFFHSLYGNGAPRKGKNKNKPSYLKNISNPKLPDTLELDQSDKLALGLLAPVVSAPAVHIAPKPHTIDSFSKAMPPIPHIDRISDSHYYFYVENNFGHWYGRNKWEKFQELPYKEKLRSMHLDKVNYLLCMALCKERNVTLTLHFKGSLNQRTK